MKNTIIKKGFDPFGNQKFYDKINKKYFTLNEKSKPRYSESVKRQAIDLYLDGVAIRAIARHLNVHHVSVLNWIKKAYLALPKPEEVTEYEEVELDEMWHFIKKKTTELGSGWLLIKPLTQSLDSNSETETTKLLKVSTTLNLVI